MDKIKSLQPELLTMPQQVQEYIDFNIRYCKVKGFLLYHNSDTSATNSSMLNATVDKHQRSVHRDASLSR